MVYLTASHLNQERFALTRCILTSSHIRIFPETVKCVRLYFVYILLSAEIQAPHSEILPFILLHYDIFVNETCKPVFSFFVIYGH